MDLTNNRPHNTPGHSTAPKPTNKSSTDPNPQVLGSSRRPWWERAHHVAAAGGGRYLQHHCENMTIDELVTYTLDSLT